MCWSRLSRQALNIGHLKHSGWIQGETGMGSKWIKRHDDGIAIAALLKEKHILCTYERGRASQLKGARQHSYFRACPCTQAGLKYRVTHQTDSPLHLSTLIAGRSQRPPHSCTWSPAPKHICHVCHELKGQKLHSIKSVHGIAHSNMWFAKDIAYLKSVRLP